MENTPKLESYSRLTLGKKEMSPSGRKSSPRTGHPSTPYVGPRPFEERQANVFFGRSWEIRELSSLVVAHRELVLHAQSAVGKSSLLRAGVFPALRARGFELLPATRVTGLVPGGDEAGIANIYAYHALSKWPIEDDERDLRGELTLPKYFARRPLDETQYRLRVIYIDQFEELFTAYPVRWKEREGFLQQLATTLEEDSRLRLLVAIRDEFVACLRDYADLFPEGLHAWFHLERLGPDAALEAIKDPVERVGYRYDTNAAEAVRDRLLQLTIQHPGGSYSMITGQFVDPLHLQLVCSRIWQGRDDKKKEIAAADVNALGDVEEALIDYYQESVRLVARKTGLRPGRLRRWFERELVTPLGTRGSVLMSDTSAGSLPVAAVRELLDRYLVRIEPRSGADWLELSHDRFVRAIRESARRSRAKRRPWEVAALVLFLFGIVAGVILMDQLRREAAAKAGIDAANRIADAAVDAQDPQDHLRALLQASASTFPFAGDPEGAHLLDALRLSVNSRRLRWRVDARVLGAAFDERGRRFATAEPNGRVRVWSVDAMQARDALPVPTEFSAWDEGSHASMMVVDFDAAAVWSERGGGQVRIVGLFPDSRVPDDSCTFGLGEMDAMAVRRREGAEPSAMVVQVAVADQQMVRQCTTGGATSAKPFNHGLSHVAALAWSTDGERLAAVGRTTTAEGRIWSPNSDTPEFRLASRDTELTSVAFGPDKSRQIATGSAQGTLTIWSLPARTMDDTLKRVEGTVLDRRGSACAGAKVVARHSSGQTVRTVTKENGHYILEDVVAGPQRLTVFWEGKALGADGDGKGSFGCGSDANGTIDVVGLATRPLTIRTNRTVSFRLIPRIRKPDEKEPEPPPEPAMLYPTQVLRGHSGAITSVRFQSTDRLVTSGEDRTVRVWSQSSGKEVTVFRGHDLGVTDVIVSSGEQPWIASIDVEGVLGWDARFGGSQIPNLASRSATAFSPGGAFMLVTDLATATPSTARSPTPSATSRVQYGELSILDTSALEPVGAVSVPASASAAVVDNHGIQVAALDASKRPLVGKGSAGAVVPTLVGSRGLLTVAFRRDGGVVAVGGWDGIIHLWNAETTVLLATRPSGQGVVWQLAFSPDNSELASAGKDGTIRFWNAQSLEPIRTLNAHEGDVRSLAFNAAGDRVASAGWDGTVKLWKTTGELVHVFAGHARPVNAVAFAPSSTLLVSGASDGLAKVWDLSGNQEIASFRHRRSVRDVQFSPDDGKKIVATDANGGVTVWDLETRRRTTLRGHMRTVWSGAFDATGKAIVTASEDGTARVWDRGTDEVRELKGHIGGVNEAVFSPDGRRIVTVGSDGSCRSWDRATGRMLAVAGGFGGTGLRSIAISPDGGRVVGIEDDGTAILLDVESQDVAEDAFQIDVPVVRACWRPDGHQIALIAKDGGVLLVRHPASVPLPPQMLSRTQGVEALALAYSADSSRLAVADRSGEISLWSVRDEQAAQLATMHGPRADVQTLAVSTDGSVVAAVTSDARLRLWNARTTFPILSESVDGNARSMDFARGDVLITVWEDGTVRRYEAAALLAESFRRVLAEGLRRLGTPFSYAVAPAIEGEPSEALKRLENLGSLSRDSERGRAADDDIKALTALIQQAGPLDVRQVIETAVRERNLPRAADPR